MLIEIDEGSGFCFGVTTAIKKAEEELAKSDSLYCLGDIVHNGREVERLKRMGLMTVEHADLESLHDTKMLLRAHGEPPQTYQTAKSQNISLIDATCPVVLNLQKRIRKAYDCIKQPALVGFYVLADHERLIEGAFFLLCRIVCKKDDRRVREKMRDMHCCPDIYAGAQDLAPKRVTVPVQPGSYFFVDGIDNDFFRH